jgi:hypothetical protein
MGYSRPLTMREWRAMGVTPCGRSPEDELANLFEPDGRGATAYLLTGKAILKYNCSNFTLCRSARTSSADDSSKSSWLMIKLR